MREETDVTVRYMEILLMEKNSSHVQMRLITENQTMKNKTEASSPLLEGIDNFRQVFGTPLFRSAKPEEMTDRDADQLRTLGIRSIIDLRSPDEHNCSVDVALCCVFHSKYLRVKKVSELEARSGKANNNILPQEEKWVPVKEFDASDVVGMGIGNGHVMTDCTVHDPVNSTGEDQAMDLDRKDFSEEMILNNPTPLTISSKDNEIIERNIRTILYSTPPPDCIREKVDACDTNLAEVHQPKNQQQHVLSERPSNGHHSQLSNDPHPLEKDENHQHLHSSSSSNKDASTPDPEVDCTSVERKKSCPRCAVGYQGRHYQFHFTGAAFMRHVVSLIPLTNLPLLVRLGSLDAHGKKCLVAQEILNPMRLIGMFRLVIDHAHEGICTALRLLCEPANLPALLCCSFGKDRTGVVTALVLSVLGFPRKHVCEDYARTAESIKQSARLQARSITEWSSHGLTDPSFATADYSTMDELLTYIDNKYGSIDEYLDSIGFGADERQKLRNVMTVTENGGTH